MGFRIKEEGKFLVLLVLGEDRWLVEGIFVGGDVF